MGQGELHRIAWQPLKYLVTVKDKRKELYLVDIGEGIMNLKISY